MDRPLHPLPFVPSLPHGCCWRCLCSVQCACSRPLCAFPAALRCPAESAQPRQRGGSGRGGERTSASRIAAGSAFRSRMCERSLPASRLTDGPASLDPRLLPGKNRRTVARFLCRRRSQVGEFKTRRCSVLLQTARHEARPQQTVPSVPVFRACSSWAAECQPPTASAEHEQQLSFPRWPLRR
jgi:hypothetical protein